MRLPLFPLFAPVHRLPRPFRPRGKPLLAALLLLALAARAVVVSLSWTPIPEPADFYRVNARSATLETNWTTTSNAFTWQIPEPGRYWFKVRAERTNGDLSAFSEEVTCEVLPTPNLASVPHVRLTVEMLTSANLLDWHTMTSNPTWLPATNPAQYFKAPRLQIEPARMP